MIDLKRLCMNCQEIVKEGWEKDKLKTPSDRWGAGKALNMRCRTCRFWVEKEGLYRDPKLGRCRRHAPTLGGWPAVFEDDWCGDHKLSSEKS